MQSRKSVESLSPGELNRNLIYAGLFLAAFELIKELVTRPVKGLYAYTYTSSGTAIPCHDYEQDVLARHKNEFEASLLYLRDYLEAISSEDFMAIQVLRKHRNDIAHNLPRMLPVMDPAENERLLSRARESLFRLSNFWIKIDIGSDPEFTSQDVDWEQVVGEDFIFCWIRSLDKRDPLE